VQRKSIYDEGGFFSTTIPFTTKSSFSDVWEKIPQGKISNIRVKSRL
jgi:hypothetical protein